MDILPKSEGKPKSRYTSKKKLWHSGLLSRDKGDNIDVWMIKIKIKSNQIDTDVCFVQK